MIGEGRPIIHSTLDEHKKNLKEGIPVPIEEDEKDVMIVNMDIDFEKLLAIKKDLENELKLVSDQKEEPLKVENESEDESNLISDSKNEVSTLPEEKTEEFKKMLYGLRDDQCKELYKKVWSRIRSETNYLHEIEESGFLQEIVDDKLEDGSEVGGVKIKWGEKDIPSKGLYDSANDVAKIRDDRPKIKESLLVLAKEGILLHGLRVLIHEVNDGILRKEGLKNSPEENKSLKREDLEENETTRRLWYLYMFREFFTRRMGQKTSERTTMYGLMEQQVNEIGDNQIKKPIEKRLKKPVNRMMFDAAHQINQLDVLGLKPREILDILKECLGDQKKDVNFCMEKKINKFCEKLKIDEDDLENLIMAQRIERQITRMRVMKIVGEEIKNESKK